MGAVTATKVWGGISLLIPLISEETLDEQLFRYCQQQLFFYEFSWKLQWYSNRTVQNIYMYYSSLVLICRSVNLHECCSVLFCAWFWGYSCAGMILTLKDTGVPECVLSGPPQLVCISISFSLSLSLYIHYIDKSIGTHLLIIEFRCSIQSHCHKCIKSST